MSIAKVIQLQSKAMDAVRVDFMDRAETGLLSKALYLAEMREPKQRVRLFVSPSATLWREFSL